MNPQVVLDLGTQALQLILLLSAPILAAGLIIGLLVSIFQAVTSIQEATLAFVPKIVVVFVALILFLPWMMKTMLSFTASLLINLPLYGR
ncbi:MAG: flagellar biosynthetic protein FliQ [Candidatus Methylomirabilota bacterium]|nr:flagellar biosynthesis protein FliQ [Candidatus Methylomirabilis sp.]NJD68887.1 flagellar biosynthesis protein FliQ [candidate division NC10 bacterium]PWB43973.1 MAG: flagellar biosynthetic protein FliQ [candidate division NC10 bacterium]